MNLRRAVYAIFVLLLAAPLAFAMSTGPSQPPTPPPSQPFPSGSGAEPSRSSPRQEAEESYALAYEDVGKAKKDLEDGKAKNGEKKFRRAQERCESAVTMDERYYEAWNLLGYASRRLGEYDKALQAYERCLAIKPDYASAREYLGEAWLDQGNAKKAREQLVWLERLGATDEMKVLKARLDAWAAAHPDSVTAPAPAAAPADSTATGAGTSGH